MGVTDAHIKLEIRRPPVGVFAPYGIRTQLGWSVVGNTPTDALDVHHIHDLVKNMWRTDALVTQPYREKVFTEEEQRAVDYVNATFAIEDGRIVAGLP